MILMIRQKNAAVSIVEGWLSVVLLVLSVTSVRADDTNPTGQLRLVGGDHLPGQLASSNATNGDRIAWKYPHFASAIDFPAHSVVSGSFPPPIPLRPSTGQFVFDLVRGDRLFGSVLEVDEWSIRIDTDSFGEILLMRSAVHRIGPWRDGASILFQGPGPVQEWTVDGNQDDWAQGGAELRTDESGASVYRNVELSNVIQVEAELRWEGKPQFVFAIGVDEKNSEESAASAFRVEVWENDVVLLRELDEVAQVIPLGSVADLDGQLSLLLQINQNDGHLMAFSPRGDKIGEFELPANDYPDVRPGLRLTNQVGNVSLDFIRVQRLSDLLSHRSREDRDSIVLEDGTVHVGQLRVIDAEEWEVVTEDSVYRMRTEHVSAVSLRDFEDADSNDDVTNVVANASSVGGDGSSSGLQIITHGGIRLTGRIRSIEDGRLTLQNDVIEGNLKITCDQIGRFSVADPRPVKSAASPFILGRLMLPDGRLTGRFIDTEDQTTPTPLRFSPRGAKPVSLAPSFRGRMVYRETPPPETKSQRLAREKREVVQRREAAKRAKQGGVWNVLASAFGNNAHNNRKVVSPRSMYLRSGEVIPCVVQAIDENGVRFSSEITGQTLLPEGHMRAIQFVADCRDPEIEVARRDRLLTVPRIRKKTRPTHLIVAVNGDILRCRLVSLSEETLVVETRLEKIEIDRSVLAQIIWLNAEERDSDDGESDAGDNANGLAVRAVLRNGNRMSMFIDRLHESVLIGEHPLLGESKINLGDVNELLIGIDINQTERDQPYGDWLLKDAPEPIIPEAGEGGGPNSGKSSALVGKPAPNFTLDLLDGGKFSVADQVGKVVVLDFWATWCGPCLQAMPVIEHAVSEFDSDDVRLVAVNLQETAEPIRETLDRLKISPEVALDIDGVAAARYQADAIPQTVVIDRDGKITRLFVGGGPALADQLREAITETLEATPEK